MTQQEIVDTLKERRMTEILELIEDAKSGDLEELELVESLGLLADETLNKEVIRLLEELGVTIIYLSGDEEDEEEDEDDEV
ncbi:hypothetical protein ABE137_22750 [Brevibacillus laterosporus]|uniref:RNA polymerase sigma factor 70 region 1.1 domain-containing protein n=1 Tax=Brevibacillus halotolerans TaxID=1507437 RepID=A0ABT4HRW2_9BACL|nr:MULTISPECIES: hypothetical protein [Brevibacillus]MCR8983820.1 hypothetical protein [Brevibacillus laterosporus]MCZ0829539.1 hypothetical protein [Brevibacillus halotolerans]MDN9010412.1 hypothetical protein [Brevibacillus laterosporus]MDO0941299.1 hypothetical protein [Brevibacillus laterosporus]OAJ73175.1 hypothetical protein AYJ08_14895 [Brevibacillus sp. SKDU10]